MTSNILGTLSPHEYANFCFLASYKDSVDGKNSLNTFTILLSHRPEKFDTYVEQSLDLVFTGHAHGGQVRFPFIGGLVAPSQGWFPKYTAGLFEAGDTTMVVNRGIGNSLFPLRIFNRPEIIEMTLKAQ